MEIEKSEVTPSQRLIINIERVATKDTRERMARETGITQSYYSRDTVKIPYTDMSDNVFKAAFTKAQYAVNASAYTLEMPYPELMDDDYFEQRVQDWLEEEARLTLMVIEDKKQLLEEVESLVRGYHDRQETPDWTDTFERIKRIGAYMAHKHERLFRVDDFDYPRDGRYGGIPSMPKEGGIFDEAAYQALTYRFSWALKESCGVFRREWEQKHQQEMKARKEAEAAAKEAAEAEREKKIAAWAEEHGSERLRLAVQGGYRVERILREEYARLLSDRIGELVDQDHLECEGYFAQHHPYYVGSLACDEKVSPSIHALKLEAIAKKIAPKGVEVGIWYTKDSDAPWVPHEDEYFEDTPSGYEVLLIDIPKSVGEVVGECEIYFLIGDAD